MTEWITKPRFVNEPRYFHLDLSCGHFAVGPDFSPRGAQVKCPSCYWLLRNRLGQVRTIGHTVLRVMPIW